MIALALIFPILFFATNKDYFQQVEKDINNGATWHYVGQQEIDPEAKSLAINDKYILWKLKK